MKFLEQYFFISFSVLQKDNVELFRNGGKKIITEKGENYKNQVKIKANERKYENKQNGECERN